MDEHRSDSERRASGNALDPASTENAEEPGTPLMSEQTCSESRPCDVENPTDITAITEFLLLTAPQRLAAGQSVLEITGFLSEGQAGSPRYLVDLARLNAKEPDEIQRLAAWVEEKQAQGWNCAHVPQPHRTHDGVAAVRAEHVIGVVEFFADLEIRCVSTEQLEACAAIFDQHLRLRPSVIVNSGAGLHLYWVMDQVRWSDRPLGEIKQFFERYQAWLDLVDWTGLLIQHGINGVTVKLDKAVNNIANPMRLPGTTNFKYPHRPRCYIVSRSGVAYQKRAFTDAFAPIEPIPSPEPAAKAAPSATSVGTPPQPPASPDASGDPPGPDVDDRRMDELFEQLDRMNRLPKWSAPMTISARCPTHLDKSASFFAKQQDDGGITLFCHVCTSGMDKAAGFAEMTKALGLPPVWFAPSFMHPNVQALHAAGGLHRYVKRVARIESLPSGAKCVLFTLAARVNPKQTGQIFGSYEELSAAMAMSPRTIRGHVRRLRSAGLLAWHSGNSHGMSNEYQLLPLPVVTESEEQDASMEA